MPEIATLSREESSPDDPLFWSVQSSPAPVERFPIASELGIETAVTNAVSSGGDTSSSEVSENRAGGKFVEVVEAAFRINDLVSSR